MSHINKPASIPQSEDQTRPFNTATSTGTRMSDRRDSDQISRRVPLLRRTPPTVEGELRRRFLEGANEGVPNSLNDRVMRSSVPSPSLSRSSSVNLGYCAMNRSPTPVQRTPPRRPFPADAQIILTRRTCLFPPESRSDQARMLNAARAVERRDSEKTAKTAKRSLASALGKKAVNKAKALKDCAKTVFTAALGRHSRPGKPEDESQPCQDVEQTVSLPGSFELPVQHDVVVYALHHVELHNPAAVMAPGLEAEAQVEGDLDLYLNDPRQQGTVSGTQPHNGSPRRRILRGMFMRRRTPPTRVERRHRAFQGSHRRLSPIVDVGTPPAGSCSTSSIPSLSSPLPSPIFDVPDPRDIATASEWMLTHDDDGAPRVRFGALRDADGPRELERIAHNRNAVARQRQRALAAGEPDQWSDRGSSVLIARLMHATAGILTPTGALMGLHGEESPLEEREGEGEDGQCLRAASMPLSA